MRLSNSERLRWIDNAGSRVDRFTDAPIETIERDEHGRLHVVSGVACGVYVVVNADDDVMYVGKVCRLEGTIDDRFRYHHAFNEEWERVWILPLHHDADPSPLEGAMIRHFQPPDNTLGR